MQGGAIYLMIHPAFLFQLRLLRPKNVRCAALIVPSVDHGPTPVDPVVAKMFLKVICISPSILHQDYRSIGDLVVGLKKVCQLPSGDRLESLLMQVRHHSAEKDITDGIGAF